MSVRFERYTLNVDTRQLLRANTEVHLSPKAFDLLTLLVLDRPRVLSKAFLLGRLWPQTFVAEANLSNLIAEIRDALHERPRRRRFIRTVHTVGYAFCADATDLPREREDPNRFSCWLQWGRRRFVLAVGEHVIGRDADVQLRLDAPTVSRRHARLLVTPDAATLEDMGSKNGTLRAGARITSPVRLVDGDSIHIGSLMMTFHTPARVMSTVTHA